MATIRAFLSIPIMFLFVFLLASPVSAQLGYPGLESSALISVEPQRFTPLETVRLSASSILLDLSSMKVTWKVNGKIIAEGQGLTSTDFTLGPLGSVHEVVMSAYSNTNTAYSTYTIVPTEMDLLWEANTFVPTFYEGRALPTENSIINLQAIARFKRPNGSFVSDDVITFTWWKNGSMIPSVSGRGRSSVSLPSPVLFGSDTVSVVATAENTFSARAEVTIPSYDPLVVLYQDHPLFGVLFNKALGDQTFVPEREMTFVAMPYYAPVRSADDKTLTYGWRVGDKNIQQDDIKRSAITINVGDQDADTIIDLRLTQNTSVFFEATGRWYVAFSQSGNNPIRSRTSNPFAGER